jgi:hypothetical protein
MCECILWDERIRRKEEAWNVNSQMACLSPRNFELLIPFQLLRNSQICPFSCSELRGVVGDWKVEGLWMKMIF